MLSGEILMLLAVANDKGGVGKTTTSIHWVRWLSQRSQKVLLVDCDKQGSAREWGKSLGFNIREMPDSNDLLEFLPKLSQEWDWVVVDGPAGNSEVCKSILMCADLILIPCQPTGLDLRASNEMLRVVRSLQSLRQGLPKAYLFLSRASTNTTLYRESLEVLNNLGFPYLKQHISNRQAIARCAGEGTTVFDQRIKDSIKEFDSLFSEVTYG